MTAGDLMPFHCRHVKHPTAEVAGIRAARITVSTIAGEDPGLSKAAGGPRDVEVQGNRIDVEIFGTNPNALRDLHGAAAANCVIGQKALAGANEIHTLKNVVFTSFTGPLEIRSSDQGGPVPMYGISGVAEWGDEDTLALMWLTAADS